MHERAWLLLWWDAEVIVWHRAKKASHLRGWIAALVAVCVAGDVSERFDVCVRSLMRAHQGTGALFHRRVCV